MSDPGLSHRLRQRSRRSGFMIGVSMILTIALCAIGFTVLYTALDAFTSDFVSSTDDTPTVAPQVAQQQPASSNQNAGDQQAAATSPPNSQQPTAPTATVAPTRDASSNTFNPDYQIDAGQTVNFREGPSTATGILDGLPPATPLMYLDEDAPTDDPADGERWMKFETEDGQVGWVREVDVTDYVP